MKVQEIADALGARVEGDGGLTIERIVHPLDVRGPADLAVAMAGEAFSALNGCAASAAVVCASADVAANRFRALIVVAEARPALATLTALFDGGPAYAPGIHATAVIAPDAQVGADASIGPYAVIGPRARIGPGTAVMAHVSVGADSVIGSDARLHPGARIGDRVRLGHRVVIHSNASIGSDGFSFVPPAKGESAGQRIHSLGDVIVGDDVEIGAGTTIDRATLRATRIGARTKIDNLVQIAHNVEIGEDCLICGMVGISGSVRIGDRVMLAGGVGVADHVTIGSDAQVGAGSGVGRDVPAGAVMLGYPAMPHLRTLEQFRNLGRLKRLIERVGALEARLAETDAAAKDSGAK